MLAKRSLGVGGRITLCLLGAGLAAVTPPVFAQERVNGAIQQHGFFQQKISPEEITVTHGSEFKGAHKVAISVFNVAFPSENHFTAISKGVSVAGMYGTSAEAHMDTALSGLDHATQQRITDAAYALFVEQLTGAGYEVVDQHELTRLAPEFATWEALPNFTQGRYGSYVAPTGQKVHLLQGDTAKRDTSGRFGSAATPFRALDRPQAFKRSPYIAYDGKLGIIAVTLVVDYGTYTSSGFKNGLGKSAVIGFTPGVTIGAGSFLDSGTYLEYWGPSSGGFPAGAYLQQPVRSDRPIGIVNAPDGPQKGKGVLFVSYTINADPAKFEAAATEVVGLAVPKLVSAMAAAR